MSNFQNQCRSIVELLEIQVSLVCYKVVFKVNFKSKKQKIGLFFLWLVARYSLGHILNQGLC